MNKLLICLALLPLAACKEPPPPTPASASFSELVARSSCLACHNTPSQMKFPSWNDIAKKYAGNDLAEDFLVEKIARGGSGSWGKMDMPPYPELSEEERRTLVKNILAQKK